MSAQDPSRTGARDPHDGPPERADGQPAEEPLPPVGDSPQAAGDPPQAGGNPLERIVAIGEAADQLGIPHVTLHQALRSGELQPVMVRRGDREVRMVRVADLLRLMASTSQGTGSRPARTGAASRGSGEARTRDKRARDADDDSTRYLWSQLDEVRAQVRSSRERHDALLGELVRSGQEVQQLFQKLHLDEESRRSSQAELARERVDIEDALRGLRRLRTWTVGAAIVATAAAVVLVLGPTRDQGPALAAAPAADRAAAQAERVPTEPPAVELAPPVAAVTEAPSAASAVAARNGSDAAPAVGPAVGPAPLPLGGPVGDPPDEAALPRVADAEETASAARRRDRARSHSTREAGATQGDPGASAADLGPEVDTEVDTGIDTQIDPEVDTAAAQAVERPIPGWPVPEARPDDRACELFALTQGSSSLRSVLGPCDGRWNPEQQFVVGSTRSAQGAFCRHHAFFARRLGGSIERARREAQFARGEGFLPPLFAMRVERSASAALQDRVPAWIQSGFEAGTQEGHHVLALDGEELWRVTSWVRYVDFGGVERRREFRVDLRLGDGEHPDTELAFAWDEPGSDGQEVSALAQGAAGDEAAPPR